ncbi:hypothetical protein RI367_005557 [Sorochytrium milnesiophthora]
MLLSFLLIAGLAVTAAVAQAQGQGGSSSSTQGGDQHSSNVIPNQYIIVYAPHANLTQISSSVRAAVAVENDRLRLRRRDLDPHVPQFDNAVRFVSSAGNHRSISGTFTPEMLAHLRQHPDVKSILPNIVMYQFQDAPQVPWNLALLNTRTGLAADGGTYSFPNRPLLSQGMVFVVDGGVLNITGEMVTANRVDFIGQLGPATGAVNDHGTHVAGIIGSRTYGVAKGVPMTDVRVFGPQNTGPSDVVLKGFNWVAARCKNYKWNVVNFSGGVMDPSPEYVEQFRRIMLNSGCNIIAAAGNGIQSSINNGINVPVDACRTYPSANEEVISVGSLDQQLRMAPDSNFGTCINILAPGAGIRSWGANGMMIQLSGTSMAAPHVAGIAALMLSDPVQAPSNNLELQQALTDISTFDRVGWFTGGFTPNVFPYVPPS